MERLLQDVRFGARMLRKDLSFTIIAVLALMLGIGANSAIFSVVNTVLLRPSGYQDPDQLVMISSSNAQKGMPRYPTAPGNYQDYRAQTRSFEDLGYSRDAMYTLTGMGEPEMIVAYRFSANFFRVLGAQPLLGRTFTEEEVRPGANGVVVISYGLWQRSFGGDRNVLGRAMTLNGEPHTIIGVMPKDFRHPQMAELWTPLIITPSDMNLRNTAYLRIAGRLKPGVTQQAAEQELNQIAARLEQQYPETNSGVRVKVMSMVDNSTSDIRPTLLALMGAVAMVLLIACANIANLMLARATARQKEIAVRLSLGATKWRLVRQFLTESLLLSLIGGLLGLLLAGWSVNLLVSLFPNNIANLGIPKIEAISIDSRVTFFTLVVAFVTGLVFGIVPALRAAKLDINEILKETSRSMTSGNSRFRNGLVVAEVAISLVLLIGAGLTLKSFWHLQQGNFGFDPQQTLTLQLNLSKHKYKDPGAYRQFMRAALTRLQQVPGVEAAGAINFLPLSGFDASLGFTIVGQPQPLPGQEFETGLRIITPDYYRSMKIQLVKGREFTAQDTDKSAQVVIINESMARKYWPNQDPIGQRINLGNQEKPEIFEVVGVVNDVRNEGLDKPAVSELHLVFEQAPYPYISYTLRTSGDPISIAAAARQAIWAVDKDQPISKVLTMATFAKESLALRRVSMILLSLFAGIALLLAAIGVYGVMAYSVNQRAHEISIRMALGAQKRDIFQMVVGQGLKLVGLGLALGIGAAIVLTRTLESMLYSVSATDPLTFIAISVLLAGVALLACYLPARRAMQFDPMVALRHY